jgi:hypothetical protein
MLREFCRCCVLEGLVGFCILNCGREFVGLEETYVHICLRLQCTFEL